MRNTKNPLGYTLAFLLIALPAFAYAQASDPNAPLPTGSNTSRPVQAGAPLIAPPPALTLADVTLELQTRLMKLPGVRAVTPMADAPSTLKLTAHNESLIRLDGLLGRLNAPRVDRESEYRRLETNIAAMLTRTDPFKPEQLRVVIRQSAAIDQFETESAAGDVRNVVVRRPFIGDLEEVVVGDTPTTIALMPAARLIDLQLSAEDAFTRGRANTLTQVQAISWRPVNGMLEVRTSSGYDTSLLALDTVWTTISQRLGGPVAVIVPTRDKIVIGRADRPRDIARLRAIVAAEAKGTGLLSNKIWVRRGTTWVER